MSRIGRKPIPLPADKMAYVADVPGLDRRITLLSFLDVVPEDCVDAWSGLGAAVAASGLGKVELTAPFYPTVPGTSTYVDELR